MKQLFTNILLLFSLSGMAQVTGYIFDEYHIPISGATVMLVGAELNIQTDINGYFALSEGQLPDTLSIHHMGYATQKMWLRSSSEDLIIYLKRDELAIEEVQVVNTGFYQIPKERATGSFTVIDNELLNRSVGGDILQRLDGVAAGVQFVTPNGSEASDIRIRGLATIQSDASPLIVVDNFPYEGDITSINPNDIDNITILKDAAAASIWGARAGNGVIVITTKQGRYGQKSQISATSNVTVGQKPNLLYSRNRLPSEVVMGIEKEKYEFGGYYVENTQQVPFPEYVEMLIARDNGSLSEDDFQKKEAALKNIEVRQEAMNYLYQPSLYQQYFVSALGGGSNYTYFVSGGYDLHRSDIIGNNNGRINLNMQNTFKPFNQLELSTAFWYSQQNGERNGLTLDDLRGSGPHIGLSPYTRLLSDEGVRLPLIKDYRRAYVEQAFDNGLLNWEYRPLDDRELIERLSYSDELRANLSVRYSFLRHFNMHTTYQYIKGTSHNTVEYDRDSYYVRNMVNRFTQPDGSLVIPYGGIFQSFDPTDSRSHSGRAQLNYEQLFESDHRVVSLVGGEVREFVAKTDPGSVMYNYNPDVLLGDTYYNYTQNYLVRPTGRARIPSPPYAKGRFTDRYLSYFANASYSYKTRYIVSASWRWDGSNLFGVKANQKGTPLWSVGSSWDLSKETWFDLNFVEHLRIRGTYGSAGNVNKSVSALPTVNHSGIDEDTGLVRSSIMSVGNPSLRWEQVNTINGGVDFRLINGRVTGSFDYYIKNGSNLIGQTYFPPSTGVFVGGTAYRTNMINYADLRTEGWDLQLNTRNVISPIQWTSFLLLSNVKNHVTKFNTDDAILISSYLNSPAAPVVGESRDMIYSIPWFGLDHDNGYPVVYLNGERSQEYGAYYTGLVREDLVKSGLRIPPVYGSLRNQFLYKSISLDFMITWKTGYVFRRTSMNSGHEYNAIYHEDYFSRWTKPGDEAHTHVPAKRPIGETVPYSGNVYNDSEILITKGDQLKLKDVGFSYTFLPKNASRSFFRKIKLQAYASNLGVIWRANEYGIDPDYPDADYIPPKTFSFGVQIDF